MLPLIKDRLEVQDPDGQAYMHFAAIAGSHELVRFLLEKGAHRDVANDDGFTPLHFAAYVTFIYILASPAIFYPLFSLVIVFSFLRSSIVCLNTLLLS